MDVSIWMEIGHCDLKNLKHFNYKIDPLKPLSKRFNCLTQQKKGVEEFLVEKNYWVGKNACFIVQWQHFSNHCGLRTPSLVVNKNKPILSLKLLTIANTLSSRNCFDLKTTSQSDFELAVNTNYVSITNVTRLGNLTTEICGQ